MFNIKPRLLEITAANVGERKDKRRAVSGLLVHAVLLRVKGGGAFGVAGQAFYRSFTEASRGSPAELTAACRSVFQGR